MITQPWLPPKPFNVSSIRKALIIPTVNAERIQWLQKDVMQEMHTETFVYCMGEQWPECHRPRTFEGNEAAAYLSFILDFYEDLPQYMFFIHDHMDQWHNDVAGPKQFETLPWIRLQAVDALGYVNMRCRHIPGCPVDVTPYDVGEEDIVSNSTRARFANIYQALFAENAPTQIGNVCCAQFVVSRAQVRKRSKSDYERMMNWLIESSEDSGQSKGWAFEKIWHIVFGMDAV